MRQSTLVPNPLHPLFAGGLPRDPHLGLTKTEWELASAMLHGSPPQDMHPSHLGALKTSLYRAVQQKLIEIDPRSQMTSQRNKRFRRPRKHP
jgi:hypothetical protein